MADNDKSPLLSVTWTDPVTGRHGYLVIDRLVRGVSSGGLRMRDGCTLAEVAGLARGMSMKEALHYDPSARYIPFGGAKGGIDFDPTSPGAYDVLVRYLRAMRPCVEQFWTTGEDLGLSQAVINRAVVEAGLVDSIQAVYPLLDDRASARSRLAEAAAVTVGDIGLGELAGGCGVAESILTALDRQGIDHYDVAVSIQGLGTMGGATARFLDQAGLRIAAVADVHGTIADPDGLDVEALLAARDPFGAVRREELKPGWRDLPRDAWLSADVDVLVPAAVSGSITPGNEQDIKARFIAEAANMPVLPEAEDKLVSRGVIVLPDVVVNSGTNAWWWWTLFGDIGARADEAFAKIRTSIRQLTGQVLAQSAERQLTPRAAAHLIAAERLPEITERFGTYR
jgi:glutamate dehydrogenase (NAD(P)+)